MCCIKKNKHVVEAFQIAHAGWNTSLDVVKLYTKNFEFKI